MTLRRFDQYPVREVQVFNKFLDIFDQRPGFRGIKAALGNYEAHPEGIEEYDIRVVTDSGGIRIEIQESQQFSRYGDLRLDYVSSFIPVSYRCSNLQRFKEDMAAGIVTVEKWGKVIEPKADFLVVEFQNGQLDWQIYHLPTLNQLLPELENAGDFRTNHKRGEAWGSAFLAVRETHPVLQRAKPTTLAEIVARTLNANNP